MDRKGNLIGVVTVTYNSGTVVDDFMESILKQTHADFVLYVVDNASSDDTLAQLAAYRDERIVLIPNGSNLGVAEGNNIGIRAAVKDECDLVLLINNDTVFDMNLISKLVDGLREHKCDMVVPKILFFDEPAKIWCAGGFFSSLRAASGHFGMGQKDDGRFDVARPVDYSPTCCMLIRRKVFAEVGLMDANYFAYFDDTDFCWRASAAGFKLFYVPAARLKHKVGSLTGTVSNFVVRFHTRNHIYFALKNYSRWRAFTYILAYCVYIPIKYMLRSPKSYWVAQKALWEGVSLFVLRVEQERKLSQAGKENHISRSNYTGLIKDQ